MPLAQTSARRRWAPACGADRDVARGPDVDHRVVERVRAGSLSDAERNPRPGIARCITQRIEIGAIDTHRVGDQSCVPIAVAHRRPPPHPVRVARHERLRKHDQLGVCLSDVTGGHLHGGGAIEEHRCGLYRRHRQRCADTVEAHCRTVVLGRPCSDRARNAPGGWSPVTPSPPRTAVVTIDRCSRRSRPGPAVAASALASVSLRLPASPGRAGRRRSLALDRLARCAPRLRSGRTVTTTVLAGSGPGRPVHGRPPAARCEGPPRCDGRPGQARAHPGERILEDLGFRRAPPRAGTHETPRTGFDHLRPGLPTMQRHQLGTRPAHPGVEIDQVVLIELEQSCRLRLGDEGPLLLRQRCHGRLGHISSSMSVRGLNQTVRADPVSPLGNSDRCGATDLTSCRSNSTSGEKRRRSKVMAKA